MSRTSSDLIVRLFTDGACSGNPGPGGWGVVMRWKDIEKEMSGHEEQTTNNRMELTAVIRGIEALKKPSKVEIYTDSQYVQKGVSEWLDGWKKRGWKTADRKPVKNQDLWEELDALQGRHEISYHWVRGHAGHPENERADRLATAAIRAGRPS